MSQTYSIEQALQIGVQCQQSGQLQQAEQIYRQILAQVPDHPDALHLLGVLAQQVGRPDASIELISRAIAVQPNVAGYHSNLAEALRRNGQLDQAEAACRRALQLNPKLAVAMGNLGSVLLDKRDLQQAETFFRRAIEIEPNLVGAMGPLVGLLEENGKVDEAIELGRRAVGLGPNDALAHNNLANALLKKDLLAEAEAVSRRAVELAPQNPSILANYGSILRIGGDLRMAMQWWTRALETSPQFERAKWDLALGYLTLGDFERGWPWYEMRFKHPNFKSHWREYSVPRWDGFDLRGKSILLYPEQGYGDVIMFARYIPILAEMGADVLVHTPPELTDVIKGISGVGRVIGPDEQLPPFDTYQALMSLPMVLHTTLATVPTKVPYIHVDASRGDAWAKRLSRDSGKLKVGLVWAGRPTHPDDKNRSIRLRELEPILRVEGVDFFSLQKGDASSQLADLPIGLSLTDLQHDLNDFADAAAAIANLDLLIGVDTAAVHLAGALAVPVWTMITLMPDFRWMLDRDDSPWYPTMRLFRQRSRGDWADVVMRVRDALAQLR